MGRDDDRRMEFDVSSFRRRNDDRHRLVSFTFNASRFGTFDDSADLGIDLPTSFEITGTPLRASQFRVLGTIEF